MKPEHWKLPPRVAGVLTTLEQAGYESYIVGGCVRDHLLGIDPHDWDMTTAALPEQVRQCFRRTYDTGIQHGTITVSVGGEHFEVTTFRLDGEYLDGRHPKDVTFTTSLVEDLRRRDFTINAMAYHPARGIQDPFGGQEDLEKKRIRGVGEPVKRFREDGLRMLRAIRFSAQLGFTIEPETFAALVQEAHLIEKISGERIREETQKLLLCPYVDRVPLIWETGLLDLGAADKTVLCPALSRAAADPAVRWALLLMGMDEASRETLVARLKFDRKTEETIRTLLREREEPLPQTLPQARRLLSRLGRETGLRWLDFRVALAQTGAEEARQLGGQIVAEGHPLTIGQLALNGNDLAALGIPKGREMGALLQKMLAAVLEDPAQNTPENLKKLLP